VCRLAVPCGVRIEGVSAEESRRILDMVHRLARRPEFPCRFSWEEGDVAIWDIIATQHYAVSDHAPHVPQDGTNHPGRHADQVTQIIVVNGGSSSGKTGITRCLQAILSRPWIRLGVDDLIEALPAKLMQSDVGVELGKDGEVEVGAGFREAEAAWTAGIAAMARVGGRVIIDDVFLSGKESQDRLREHLQGLDVLWVGVRCDPEIAAGREIARGDRVPGMAASQAEKVHKGVVYDVEVDTSHTESVECARAIAKHVV
jgi:chloramphenicol 3-O phosphotransferase